MKIEYNMRNEKRVNAEEKKKMVCGLIIYQAKLIGKRILFYYFLNIFLDDKQWHG